MPLNTEQEKGNIAELVRNYEQLGYEERARLSEADVQASFIDRLFHALGWNVYNDPNQETAYRRQGYIRGAGIVDVGMEIAGKPALMQEAKRFGIIGESAKRTSDRTLEEKQVFRYARGRGIPYAILSSFERLQVFNADHERLILSFDSPREYLARLDDLLLLSPDKIKAGSLQWLERQTGIKDVDEAFLASMKEWRLRLANAIYRQNTANSELQTNESFDFGKLMMAVQRILDRLMLIRYADDKEVLLVFDILDSILADYRKRGPYAKPDHLMQQFLDFSHMMDQHHNTKLFQAGHICEKVVIPNDVLASVMEEMNSISFRKFTSDILGATYESYLATKLVLRNGKIQAEEQRDTRKKGGIYYTPPWVVHYIVDNTLGKLLAELEAQHGVKAVEKAAELRVLDPACGSGSFLIYAYRMLADFYRRMNEAIEEERVKLITPVAGVDMFQRLEMLKVIPEPVIDYPQHILMNQLYGVELDPEAAEIAAVNLTMAAIADSRQAKLPLILDENIKVGNSLVSGSEDELRGYFGEKWAEEKPFNWQEHFGEIMRRGGFDVGFDVIVGNPPYGSKKMLTVQERDYVRDHIKCNASNDMAELFLSRASTLSRHDGYLGFIVPKPLTYITSWWQIREYLKERDIGIVDVSKAFEGVLLEQAILTFRNSEAKESAVRVSAAEEKRIQSAWYVKRSFLEKRIFPLYLSGEVEHLFARVWEKSHKLSEVANIFAGIGGVTSNLVRYESKGAMQCLRGNNVDRYALSGRSIFSLLAGCYSKDDLDQHSTPRIVCQDIVAHIENPIPHIRIAATLETTARLTHETVINIALKEKPGDIGYLRCLLGLINSKLVSWYAYNFIFNRAVRTMHFRPGYADYIPVKTFGLNALQDQMLHELTGLVDAMLSLKQRQSALPKGVGDWQHIQDELTATDDRVDRLVYDLYAFTEEERHIVDGASWPIASSTSSG
ncbi:MAG: N-6 DNA methylase [Chloroflexi bacterium]|nr:N-6 DNA methylase [Chloroflexota bacterium]